MDFSYGIVSASVLTTGQVVLLDSNAAFLVCKSEPCNTLAAWGAEVNLPVILGAGRFQVQGTKITYLAQSGTRTDNSAAANQFRIATCDTATVTDCFQATAGSLTHFTGDGVGVAMNLSYQNTADFGPYPIVTSRGTYASWQFRTSGGTGNDSAYWQFCAAGQNCSQSSNWSAPSLYFGLVHTWDMYGVMDAFVADDGNVAVPLENWTTTGTLVFGNL